MDTTSLKNYAPQARKKFIQVITDRAALFGLTAKKVEPVTVQGDVAIIGGKAFPSSVVEKRQQLEERIDLQGFEHTMEAIAYTWFNRLVAIRYMELHGYLDHGYRVLSHPESDTETPEILQYAEHVNLPGLNNDEVIELKLDGSKEPELYRKLLIAQCNALHEAMPFLFEQIDDDSELLLPDNLLHSDSIIRNLVSAIDEDDWQEVEIIGWLYQFYISEKKSEVIGKVVKSEDIPAATQLFTPNWIVKYLVQNSLGRQWVATYPDSPLKEKMEYYIEPAEQTPEVQAKLDEITPDSLNPEELTLLDPACGSGHILVEAYDLLKEIYLERGYRLRDIPALILAKNLFGLEIDDRAAQLAAFALTMKARADDRQIFNGRHQPNVVSIQESNGLDINGIVQAFTSKTVTDESFAPPGEFGFMAPIKAPLLAGEEAERVDDEQVATDLKSLLHQFEDAKTYGSLITIPEDLAKRLPALAATVKEALSKTDISNQWAVQVANMFVSQASLLAGEYDFVITNPPYLGKKYFLASLRHYSLCTTPASSANLFSLFVTRSRQFAGKKGSFALITLHNWMYLSDFTDFRIDLLSSCDLTSLIHLGPHAFPEISGEMVQTAAFSFQPMETSNLQTPFLRLVAGDSEHKRNDFLDRRHLHLCDAKVRFAHIDGWPVLYWFSDTALEAFAKGSPLGDVAKPRAGLSTGKNEQFQRYWFEVSIESIGFGYVSASQTSDGEHRWFPCNSGGENIKWYGNHLVVVDWQFDGRRIRTFTDANGKLRSRPQNTGYYFREGLTWNKLGSSGFAARFKTSGFVFDDTARSAFPDTRHHTLCVLGVLNSILGRNILPALNPSMSFTNWDLARIPMLFDDGVVSLVQDLVKLAKARWDEQELSWDFKSDPVVSIDGDINSVLGSMDSYAVASEDLWASMQYTERKLDQVLVSLYGLTGESRVLLNKDDSVKNGWSLLHATSSLISYAIGCMLGRYSLDEPGLAYAHSGNEGFDPSRYKTFPADADGIVPMTEFDWFEDDAARRFEEFIGVAWPKEHLEENLAFVAEQLAAKKNEQPRDTIRRYFAKGFFKDHLQTYKVLKHPPRPIYWLFTSGKLGAFQALA